MKKIILVLFYICIFAVVMVGVTIPASAKTATLMENFDEVGDWTLGDTWEITENGYLHSTNNTGTQYYATRQIECDGDFVFEARIKDASDGYQKYFALYWDFGYAHVDIQMDRLDAGNSVGRKAGETIALDHLWHEYRIETFNDRTEYVIYVDGKKYMETPAKIAFSGAFESKIVFNSWGHRNDPVDIYVDWISYTPKDSSVQVTSPINGDVFTEGDTISLAATTNSATSVAYKINGKQVTTTASATINGLVAGNYQVTVIADGVESEAVNFAVVPAGDLSLSVVDNGSGNLTLGCSLADNNSKVSLIQYLLDGVVVAEKTNSAAIETITGVNPGRHHVSVVAYSTTGVRLFEDSKSVLTVSNTDNKSTSYANEISYIVSGTTGNAIYELKNGNHQLKLMHMPDKVTYLTDKGEESFSGGTGEFAILTEGPTADVYRNGQLAFSYYMPQTSLVSTTATEDGLTISDVSVTVPEERRTYFVKRGITESTAFRNIPDMPYIYNLDFVTCNDDEFRLVVNDGYFKMDLTMEDGKFYALTMHDDNSEPEVKYLADVPACNTDVYYRVETTAGMSRLYANGRWLASFRCVHSSGGNSIVVETMVGNEIKYLSLGDNNDVFLYSDDFKDTGEFDTAEYWQPSENMTYSIDTINGKMSVGAQTVDEAFIELYAFAGQSEISVDVENVTYAIGEGFMDKLLKRPMAGSGVWFVANHSTSDKYTKIGYSFRDGQYRVVTYSNGGETVLKSVTAASPGSAFHLTLKINEIHTDVKTATLYVNGEAVISYEYENFMRGRIGLGVDYTTLCVTNVSYRGDAKPLAGVSESVTDQNGSTSICFFDAIENDEDVILTHYGSNRYVSSDNGKTWEAETRKDYDSYDNVRLKSGKILGAKYIILGTDEQGNKNKTMGFYSSNDNGETWEYVSALPIEEYSLGHKQNSMRQGPSGRIYFITMHSNNENYGNARIWVSDDEGLSWKETAFFEGKDLNLTIGEATIIEGTDGITKCYFRSNTGYITYFVSEDYGETWDTTPYSTPFFSPANMYNIDYDPNDKSTVYIAWGYDNAGLDARTQFNRSRWGVAKSDDNGKTWGFIGTYHENIDGWNQFMNLNVLIPNGCIIAEAASYDGHGTYTRRIVSQDKAMEKPVKKFERLHMKDFGQIENTEAVMQDSRLRTLVVQPDKGNVLVSERLVQNAAYDGYVALDCAAAYIGATISGDSTSGVTLTLGGATTTFAADMLEEINSQTFISIEAFADSYGLNVVNEDGIQIISPYQEWSESQIRAFKYSVDVLASGIMAETYPLTSLIDEFYGIRKTVEGQSITSDDDAGTEMVMESPDDGIAPLGYSGDAVEIKFTTSLAEGQSVMLKIHDADGKVVHLKISDYLNGYVSTSNGAICYFTEEQIRKILNVDTTLLFVNNGETYSIYLKENDGNWSELVATTGKRDGEGTASLSVEAVGMGAAVDIGYIKYYDGRLMGDTHTSRGTITTLNENGYSEQLATGGYVLGHTGDFAKITFNANVDVNPEDAAQSVTLIAAKADGYRFYMNIHETNAWIKYGSGDGTNDLVKNLGAEVADKMRNGETTLLFRNDGDTYTMYLKEHDGSYEKIFTGLWMHSKDATRTNVYLGGSNCNPALTSVNCYSVQTAAGLVGNDYMSTYTYKNTSTDKLVSGLTTPSLTDTPYLGATGDAIEMRIKIPSDSVSTSSYVKIEASDAENNRLALLVYSDKLTMWIGNNSTVTKAISVVDEWVTFLVINNGEGYDVYIKKEGDAHYIGPVFSTTSSRDAERYNVWIDGSVYVDYVKRYSPAGKDGLLVTNGSLATLEVVEGATIEGDLRAIVSGESGVLIFAGYDTETNELVTAKICPVDGTTAAVEEILDTTELDARISEVKVFFWDSLKDLNPVSDPRIVSVN